MEPVFGKIFPLVEIVYLKMNMSLIWEVVNANNCFLLSSLKSGSVKLRLNLPKLIFFYVWFLRVHFIVVIK